MRDLPATILGCGPALEADDDSALAAPPVLYDNLPMKCVNKPMWVLARLLKANTRAAKISFAVHPQPRSVLAQPALMRDLWRKVAVRADDNPVLNEVALRVRDLLTDEQQ